MELSWIANMSKSSADKIGRAAAQSGKNVEWRDEPDEKMAYFGERANYGSIWSTESDLRPFWEAYLEINQAAV